MIFENLTSLFRLEGNFQILVCHGVGEVPQSPEKVKKKKKLGPQGVGEKQVGYNYPSPPPLE